MNAGIVFFEFLYWTYGEGLEEFFKAWSNLHWFFYHFFSVPVLLKNIFQPLKRLSEGYGSIFEPEKFFGALILNTVMRVVGFFTRTVILLSALIFQILTLAFGILALILFVGWIFLVPLGVFWGLTLALF